MSARNTTRDLRLLVRPLVSVAAAGLAGLGCLLARGAIVPALSPTVLGVFFLACGASACNQFQEKKRDALMHRTRHRPLPAGRMRPGAALGVACVCVATGLTLLHTAGGVRAVVAGLVPLALYNGLYTPLKTRTVSLLPGLLAGAAPLLTGVVAAGGDPLEPRALLVFGIAALWQIPHFWLRALRHKDDYLRAGFAVPFLGLSPDVGSRAALLWLPALGASLPLPALFFHPPHVATALLLGSVTILLSVIPLQVLRRRLEPALALRAADIAVCIGFLLIPLDMGLHHM